MFIRFICEESLLHLVTSLCQLSEEDMQVVPGKVQQHCYSIVANIIIVIILRIFVCSL